MRPACGPTRSAPWTRGTNPHSIRPAKGIHITVPDTVFPCDIAAVIPVKEDHRSIFVVSWGDQVYLGTTDTEWDGPLDDPSCLPEDVDYVLAAANAITTRPITRGDITGLWTGLRPLLAPVEGKHPMSERTADLSRRHTVRTSPEGMVTVTGGKLTTYRKMAEDTVDAVVGALGRRSLRCVTKDLRLRGAGRGGHAAPQAGGGDPSVGAPTSAAASVATHLAGRYGTETPDVLAVSDGRPELLDPLVPGLHYLEAEAVYAVRHEMACSVADVLDRRTRASLRDARGAAAAAGRVAMLIGPELEWDQRPDRAGGSHLCGRGPCRTRTGRARGRGRVGGRHRRPRPGAPMTRPTPVTSIDAGPGLVTDHLGGTRVGVDDALLGRLGDVCDEVTVDDGERAESARDWWPLAIDWATAGQVPARPAVVARPTDTAQVAAVLSLCDQARVPVTAAGGRSGVCGASIPLFGGVALDLCGLAGIGDVDADSLVADLRAGTFGPDVESGLRGGHGLTLGHWPQSMDLSTVGGWLACRGAGQYSNRYGKIEDMVIGLEVVLADGRVIRTGGHGPRVGDRPRPHPALRRQ